MKLIRTIRGQWVGILGVALGLTGVAFSAAGQPAILGQRNEANRPTVLKNTGSGPAAAFKVKAGTAPFSVNSSALVARLNAARLGGKKPSAFAEVNSVYSRTQSDAKYIDSTEITNYYTADYINQNFAPKSGSFEYAPFDTWVIAAPAVSEMTVNGRQTVFSGDYTAPGDGYLWLRVAGTCTGTNVRMTPYFVVGLTSTHDNVAVNGTDVLCTTTVSLHVTGGTRFEAGVDLGETDAVASTIKDWSFSVTWTPQ